jgi:hypothetical protein
MSDEPTLIEPSDDERARLPETTRAYIDGLEERLDTRDQQIAELEQALQKERERAAFWRRATSRARRRADALGRENARLREREGHYASRLGVADGGQYRNDWDCPLDRLAGILSDMGASPERAGEVLAEIERRVADQPADAGGASCCARTRADERERCARQLEATAARLEQRAATAPTVALRTGLNADARMCRMNAAAIRRTGDTGGRDE